MLKIIKSSIVIIILLIALGIYLIMNQKNEIVNLDESGPLVTQEILAINANSLSNIPNELEEDSPAFTELIAEAEELYQNGYVDQALNTYLEAYNSNNDSTLPFLGIAKIYLDHEKIDLAEQNLLIAKQKGRLSTQAKILITRLNILKINYDQAQNTLDLISNQNSETLYLSCILNLLNGNYPDSQDNLSELAKLNSNDIFSQAGSKLEEAFEIYDTFTDSPQSYLLTLSAENLIDVNEFALARPLLLQAINEKPDYRDPWILLGYSYLQSNLLQDAEQALKKAKQVDPYFGTTYFYLGLTKEALGQTDLAIQYLQDAEGFGYPYPANIYLHLANTYYEKETYPKAADNFLKAMQLGSLDLPDYAKPIWLFLEPLDNQPKALEVAENAFEKFPDQAMSFNLLGWAQLANNKLDEAKSNLEKAIALDKYLEAAYYNLGNLYNLEGKTKIAIAYYEKAIKYSQENQNNSILERATHDLQILQNKELERAQESNTNTN